MKHLRIAAFATAVGAAFRRSERGACDLPSKRLRLAIGEFGQIAEGSLVSVTSAHWAAGSASKTIAWSQ